MAIQNIPVWSFEPDWSQSVLETCEWLTKILRSRTGAEQRRSLRYMPRRYLEYTSLLEGPNRALFDNMLTGVGFGDFYLPQWHEAFPAIVSGVTVDLADAAHSIRPGGVVWLQGFDAGALHEVQGVSGAVLTLTAPVGLSGEHGLVLHPVSVGRLIELPSVTRRRDTLAVSRVKMRLIGTEAPADETVDVSAFDSLLTYGGRPLMLTPPHESEELAYGYERLSEEIDNMTSIPIRQDITVTPFTTQKYIWRIVGHQEYIDFKKLLYAIRGRATSFWLPTFFSDFENTRPIEASSRIMYVKNTGFSLLSQGLINRQDVYIEYSDGRLHCTRIASSQIVNDFEESLEFTGEIPLGDPVLISLMSEVRFDQDNIELAHETDTAGITNASVIVRGTPTIRRALPAA